MNEVQKLKEEELISRISNVDNNVRFSFFFGAGASLRSAIPLAQSLCETWIKEIEKGPSPKAVKEEWKKNPSSLSVFYSDIFETRFRANLDLGDKFLQEHMDKASSSIGYLFLAEILAQTKNKVVITTNFDTLSEDALFYLKNKKPLVIGHPSLAEHLKTTDLDRPVIIKLHHDFLLKPKSFEEETKKLAPEFKAKLDLILEATHLIVLGYSGNDNSVMDYLKNNKKRKPIYWCRLAKDALSKKVEETLIEKDFIVEIKDFDRFMLLLRGKFPGIKSLIDTDNPSESLLITDVNNKVEKCLNQLERLFQSSNEKEEPSWSQEEKDSIKKQIPPWGIYESRVNETENNDNKNAIYLEGLNIYRKNPKFLNNYARFLENIRNNYDEAEKYYKEALALDLDLDPNHALITFNYAGFLENIRKDYDEAEKYYKKALEVMPHHATINHNYAEFLKNIRNDYDEAERYFKKALELEPNNALMNSNYAGFLGGIRTNCDEAEKYFKKALKLGPNKALINSHYAGFLVRIRKDYDEAEKCFQKALKLEPNNALITFNYAEFLKNICNDYAKAEKYFQKALKLEPNNTLMNSNYARFLENISKDYAKAEKYFKKSLELESN